MNDSQLHAAQENMITWLSNPHELGKSPSKMEYTGHFKYNEMTYYVFKFKAGIFGKWLVGVSGGFEGDELNPCGHTFSDMQPYDATSAQEECIKMIERIMDYWKDQAKKYPG